MNLHEKEADIEFRGEYYVTASRFIGIRRQLEAENARLKEELAEAQTDAARYRWLREHPGYMGWEHDFRPDEVDTAVDKEMKEQS